MKELVRQTCMFGLLAPSPAAASGEGEFIEIAWFVFVGYCAIVIIPHGFRAVWFLWKEARTRRAKETAADT